MLKQGQEKARKEEEEKILQELANPETHRDPRRVKDLTKRLGELKKSPR